VKGYVRIGGSIVFGILIVLGAFYLQSKQGSTAPQGTLVSAPPERQYIATADSNGDGVNDWEESLNAKVFEAIQAPTSTNSTSAKEVYTPPTTFTGKFSEAFFKDYMEGKVTQGDLQNSDALVQNAVNAIEENTKSKLYTRLDIISIPDSETAFREYGNSISAIIQKYSVNNENELFILKRALEKNDPSILEDLKPVYVAYENIIHDTLLVPVPESFIVKHLDLLSSYEGIFTDIGAMQQTFTDPLYALARTKRYEDDAKGLAASLINISNALRLQGVTYAKDEPGAFFYILGI